MKLNITLKNLLLLTRSNLSIAIGFSAVAGQLLYCHSVNMYSLYTFLGVYLLSGSASALNQYQERFRDAIMGRTHNRPLPSGQITTKAALIISLITGLAGFLILFFATTWISAALGILNMMCYNLVYTPLKRKYSYSLLIGAITGAIPPVIGWCASGGYIFAPTIIPVAVFMYLWQIPHFWLILFKYDTEYEAAGFGPLLFITRLGNKKDILFIWILGTSVSTILFPYFHIVSSMSLILILLAMNVFLISFFYKLLFNSKPTFNIRMAFGSFYLYQLLILAILILNAFFY